MWSLYGEYSVREFLLVDDGAGAEMPKQYRTSNYYETAPCLKS